MAHDDSHHSFDAFFSAHRRGVESFVHSRLRRAADVDDVCADVFVVAWRRFGDIRDEPTPAARRWLLRVAELHCCTYRRSIRRRGLADSRAATIGHDRPDVQPVESSLIGAEARAEAIRLVNDVIGALPGSYSSLLLLEADGSVSRTEMAAHLGVSPVALRLRLMRARRAFRAEHERRPAPDAGTTDRADETPVADSDTSVHGGW